MRQKDPSPARSRSIENGHVYGAWKMDTDTPTWPPLKTDGHWTEHSPLRQDLSKKAFTLSLGMTMVLCFLSVFICIGMLGRPNRVHTLNLIPTLGSYRLHRHLQVDVVLDPFKGGIFGRGTVRLKELVVCQGLKDHVPCHNTSLSFWGLPEGPNPHCKLQDKVNHCLIQHPYNYHIPVRWPASRDIVWHSNMKFMGGEQPSLRGTNTLRLKLEDGQVHVDAKASNQDGVGGVLEEVVKLLDLLSVTSKHKILDIGCELGQNVDRILSKDSWALCVAPYEIDGSRVQFALERGLPAVIGSITHQRLPFLMSSFGGSFILELDRLLKSGGYYVEASSNVIQFMVANKDVEMKEDFASRMCWSVVAKLDRAVVWKKTANETCYASWGMKAVPKLCNPMQKPSMTLSACLSVSTLAPRAQMQQPFDSIQRSISGFATHEFLDGSHAWSTLVRSYWSLLTPLIFSDHPKRPGEEDPLPPSNIVRNVMDMNAMHGSLNAALLAADMSVWVMNVVPSSGPNTLSFIGDSGFIGISHDWCEAFPTYPRTYDLLHGIGLLSQEGNRPDRCGLSNLFLEMDRILRPEGWVILHDKLELIEDARVAASQMRWVSRVVNLEGFDDMQLLVCQKIFWKNQS